MVNLQVNANLHMDLTSLRCTCYGMSRFTGNVVSASVERDASLWIPPFFFSCCLFVFLMKRHSPDPVLHLLQTAVLVIPSVIVLAPVLNNLFALIQKKRTI